MTTTTTIATHAFTTQDIEYLRHGAKPLLLRLYTPEGRGPFPVVVELHGGAWSSGDRTLEHFRHDALAQSGLAVASLDFRQGKEGAYPLQVADINYAVRWVKAHAKEFKLDPGRVGISGQSSGAHLAMLVAMRPNDPRYAAIALPAGTPQTDASVRAVAMSWPVINPLSRFRHALRENERGAAWAAGPIQGHRDYWPGEADMADGNPVLILERGEKVRTPPALWIQTPNDPQHNYRDPDGAFEGNEPERFADRYRKAGGAIDLVYFDAPQRFTSVAPTSPASIDAFRRISSFFHKHLAEG
ncbi:MAG TPA: alpha/beta hydrolase [Stellaceae bacterium]|nr:alpha/beta hydrolase [Stellaceae bacterium]